MTDRELTVEIHPFEPFLPASTRLLMCGTFPPKPVRWAMEFYYPNFQNDMWRICGLIYKNDKEYFIDREHRTFHLELIKQFCREKGIGMTDTGHRVHRLRDNASDKFLQILEPFDLDALLDRIPHCRALAVTGELAGDTLCSIVGCDDLKIGSPLKVEYRGRQLELWRLPSSSRAYPRPVEWKAEYYREALESVWRNSIAD